MNRTHLFHPSWTGHARLHLFWAALSQFAVSALALALIWRIGDGTPRYCEIAAIIGLCMTGGFWGAVATKRWFGGTLHDPKGIPPIGGKLDGNVVAVLVIDGLLVWGWLLLPLHPGLL